MTRIYSFGIAIVMLSLITFFTIPQSIAKEYRTTSGEAGFTVSAPAKSIAGKTNAVAITLNTDSKKVTVEVPVKSFSFKNNFDAPEMNETVYKRFNEHYMRSAEYPSIRYEGEILNMSEINFKKEGTYPVLMKGKLSISRGAQEQEISGRLTVKSGKITLSAEIVIYPYQYKIGIPKYIGKMYFGEVHVNATAELN